jgi:uncharacterized BrkB/YihY/UPF0761 family membrane protein
MDEPVKGNEEDGGRLQRLRTRAAALKESSTAWVDRTRSQHDTVDFILTTGERDRILGGSLVAGAIAFRMFLLLVPMMVVVVAIVGLVTNVSTYSSSQLVRRLGMVGYVADSVADAAKLSTGTSWTVLVVALWILLLTARSFARALRTAHALAWSLPIRRWPNGTKAGLTVIGFLLLLMGAVVLLNSLRRETVLATIAVAFLTGVVMAGIWMGASRLLPHSGDRWLDLLPGGLLVGFGVQLINIGVIYFTWRASRAEAFYGPLGLSIVLLAWLYIMGRLLIASAVLNANRYMRRTGIQPVPTVLTAVDDAVAGVDAGARLSASSPSVAASGQAAATVTVAVTESEVRPMATEEPAGGAAPAEGAPEPSPAADTEGAAPSGPTAEESAPATAAQQGGGEPAAAEGAEGPSPAAGAGASPPEKTGKRRRTRKPHRGRRIAAMVLVILAAIVSVIMMVSLWAHDFLLNTDTFVATVTPVLEDPQVTQRMGQIVAEKTIELTDAEARLEEVLPPRLTFIAAPIVGQVEQQLAKTTTRLLRSERGQAAWENILRFTHKSVIALLTDQSKFLKIYDDEIRLDLLPLVVAAINRLEDILPDVIASRAPLPDFSPEQSPEEQRAELAQALGKPVSDDFAQITLFKGEQVETAQRTLRLFELLVWAVVALTAVLVIAAIAVSPRRLHTLIHLGVAAVLAVVLTRVAINQAEQAIIDTAAQTQALPVVRAGVDSVFSSLQNLIIWGLVAGAVVGVGAYIATKPRWLWRLGGRLKEWTKAAGAWGKTAGAQAAEHRDPALEWIRAHRDGLLIGIAVVAVVLLLFFTGSLAGALVIIVIGALLAAAVYWIGRTPPEPGPPDTGPVAAVSATEAPVGSPPAGGGAGSSSGRADGPETTS